jgi:enoyl-CoA hydratase/carnithine racemase
VSARFRYGEIDLSGPLEGLRYEKLDSIATITLDRADKGNSLTKKMEQILRAIWS